MAVVEEACLGEGSPSGVSGLSKSASTWWYRLEGGENEVKVLEEAS